MKPIESQQPERRITPEELGRMMLTGQIGQGWPSATTIIRKSPAKRQDGRDQAEATKAADRLILKHSGAVPICSASISRSEADQRFKIEIIVSGWKDQQQIRGRIGYTFEGFEVAVHTLDRNP